MHKSMIFCAAAMLGAAVCTPTEASARGGHRGVGHRGGHHGGHHGFHHGGHRGVHHGVWHTHTAEALRQNTLPVERGRALTPRGDLEGEADLEFLYDEWLFGTPDVVAKKVERLTQLTGMTYLNCAFAVGQIPQAQILRSMRLFAREIMPHFRAYEPDQAAYPLGEHWLVGATAATARSAEELRGHPG